jgi:hypothetical protein
MLKFPRSVSAPKQRQANPERQDVIHKERNQAKTKGLMGKLPRSTTQLKSSRGYLTVGAKGSASEPSAESTTEILLLAGSPATVEMRTLKRDMAGTL